MLGSNRPDCREQPNLVMQNIGDGGCPALIYLRQDGRTPLSADKTYAVLVGIKLEGATLE
jgi:GTP cyclohydrolase II